MKISVNKVYEAVLETLSKKRTDKAAEIRAKINDLAKGFSTPPDSLTLFVPIDGSDQRFELSLSRLGLALADLAGKKAAKAKGLQPSPDRYDRTDISFKPFTSEVIVSLNGKLQGDGFSVNGTFTVSVPVSKVDSLAAAYLKNHASLLKKVEKLYAEAETNLKQYGSGSYSQNLLVQSLVQKAVMARPENKDFSAFVDSLVKQVMEHFAKQ